MFYTEEDVSLAVNHAENIFGITGIYNSGNNIHPNISLATREYGKIWYGDVDKNSMEANCKMLSSRLNQRVYLFYQTANYMYDSAPVFFNEGQKS